MNARTGVNQTELKKGFRKACELAGIPYGLNTQGGVTPHTMRHTFATRLAERGTHDVTIMRLLGNSSLKMSRRYTHATPESMQDAIEKLGAGTGDLVQFKQVRQNSANEDAAKTEARRVTVYVLTT